MTPNASALSLILSAAVLIAGCSAPSPAETPAATPAPAPATDAAPPQPPQAPAPAQPDPAATAAPEEKTSMTRASYQQCIDQTEGVTPAIQECVDEEYEYQDKRLNDAYKALLAKLPAARHDGLREQQRAWIKKRDADCDSGPEPGQGQVLEANACLLDMTAARAGELETLLAGA